MILSVGGAIGIIPIRRPDHCRGEDRQGDQSSGQYFTNSEVIFVVSIFTSIDNSISHYDTP